MDKSLSFVRFLFVLLALTIGCRCGVYAADAVVKLRTSAAKGTTLRLSMQPFGSQTIKGAVQLEYINDYMVTSETGEITITGSLEQLECYGAQLTGLTIESAPDLFILKCYDNKLESLDVSAATKLAILECQNNVINSLELGALAELEEVNAGHNALTSLTMPAEGSKLMRLDVSVNKLEQLDLSRCSTMDRLYVNNNPQLSALDLSSCAKLDWLWAFGCGMSGNAMETFISNLPSIGAGMAYLVNTRDDAETNECLMENVAAAATRGWVVMDYLGGAEGAMLGAVYKGKDYVPVADESSITMTTSRVPGDKITLDLAKSSDGDITVSGVKETGPYTGKLTYTLTSSTVTINGKVTRLNCATQDLTSLSVVKGADLTDLDCSDNKLTSLTLDGTSKLARLYAQRNNLSELLLTDCVELLRVDVQQNAISGSRMSALVGSLRQASKDVGPVICVIDTKPAKGVEANVCLKSDVATATERGWNVMDYGGDGRYGMLYKYAGSDPVVDRSKYVILTAPKNENIMATIAFDPVSAEIPEVDGATVAGWNGDEGILTLKVTGDTVKIYGVMTEFAAPFSVITSADFSHSPMLKEINVGLNNLSSLTLGSLTHLDALSCEACGLKSLDISGLTSLTYLNIYGNALVGDAMDAVIAALPMRTKANYGQLIVYDGNYEKEANRCTPANVRDAMDKWWAVFELDASMEPKQYFGYSALDAATADVVSDPEVYTIGGVRLKAPIESLPAGTYIVRRGSSVSKIQR